MVGRSRLYARLGIFGAWTALVSALLLYVGVVVASRIGPSSAFATPVGLSLAGFLSAWLTALSDVGAVGVGVGLLFLVVGWARLLTLVP
jgi:hypothetical protein